MPSVFSTPFTAAHVCISYVAAQNHSLVARAMLFRALLTRSKSLREKVGDGWSCSWLLSRFHDNELGHHLRVPSRQHSHHPCEILYTHSRMFVSGAPLARERARTFFCIIILLTQQRFWDEITHLNKLQV